MSEFSSLPLHGLENLPIPPRLRFLYGDSADILVLSLFGTWSLRLASHERFRDDPRVETLQVFTTLRGRLFYPHSIVTFMMRGEENRQVVIDNVGNFNVLYEILRASRNSRELPLNRLKMDVRRSNFRLLNAAPLRAEIDSVPELMIGEDLPSSIPNSLSPSVADSDVDAVEQMYRAVESPPPTPQPNPLLDFPLTQKGPSNDER